MTDASFWDNAARKYAAAPIADPAAYALTRDRMRAILQPHHRVLELGCGTGSTALELAAGVTRYVATDVSPRMIEIARAKQTRDTPAQLSFAVAPADALPEGGHDVVLALNLFHLVGDLEQVLRRIYAALSPGGLLISKTGLVAEGPWYIRAAIPVMRALGKAPFVRSLAADELETLLRRAGFTVSERLVQGGMVPRLFLVAAKP